MEQVFYRIIVPTDFSSSSEAAWALAQRIAGSSSAELVLTHVLVETPPFSEGFMSRDRLRAVYDSTRKWADETLEKWAEAARAKGLRVRVALRVGVPHEEIAALATDERADLVVLGTHGRGGINRALLGSVADRVIRLAPCPVMSVREPS